MKCKRFSVAKRDLLLTKLRNINLGLGYLMTMNVDDIKALRGQLSECIIMLQGSLGD